MTAERSGNPWAILDGLLGGEVAEEPVEQGIGRVAFYGRCSTEDNQDPETSLGWQLSNARRFVEPLGGTVVAEFFDVGQSRSVPWERRGEAARLLAELKRPNRGWGGVVVGEGTRCWFGNQFSLDRAEVHRLSSGPVGSGAGWQIRCPQPLADDVDERARRMSESERQGAAIHALAYYYHQNSWRHA
jgi:hypothetical protein